MAQCMELNTQFDCNFFLYYISCVHVEKEGELNVVTVRRFWYHAQSCKLGYLSRGWEKAEVQCRRANKERAELISTYIGLHRGFNPNLPNIKTLEIQADILVWIWSKDSVCGRDENLTFCCLFRWPKKVVKSRLIWEKEGYLGLFFLLGTLTCEATTDKKVCYS